MGGDELGEDFDEAVDEMEEGGLPEGEAGDEDLDV
jgi:hypothetical protein